MARRTAIPPSPASGTSAAVGHEAQLWMMANALRGGMDAAGYKYVVLGLIFMVSISDLGDERLRDANHWRHDAPLMGSACAP